MNPETLAASLRVAQHGARSAMLAARRPLIVDAQKSPTEGSGPPPTPADGARQAGDDGLR